MVRRRTSSPFHPPAPSGFDEPHFIVAIGFQTDRRQSNPSLAWKDSDCPQDSSAGNKAVKGRSTQAHEDRVGREQHIMNVRIKLGVVAASVAALALSACGSSSLSGDPGAQEAPSVSVSENVDLASKLPENIKSAGVIKIGTDPTYAPNEFLAADGKTVQGFEVDLFNQVAAKFGVKTQWEPSKFGSIITGVTGKKYDMGISSFTINPERMKEVDMVSYFKAGTQWATQPGNPKGIDPENACGKNVAVQTGTVQETDDLPVRQKKCGSNKINVLSYDSQAQATSAVVTGKADAMLADSPVGAYAVKQSGGKLEPLGDIYDAAPYGFVLPKGETEFAQAIVEALKQLEQEGTYKAALEKWGVEQGAISDFTVNPSS
jgi:polar amino acid transport system substrate-binding protein